MGQILLAKSTTIHTDVLCCTEKLASSNNKSLPFCSTHDSSRRHATQFPLARASFFQNHRCDLGGTWIMTLIYKMHNDAGRTHQVFHRKSLHRSLLAEALQYGIDVVKGLVNFRPYLGTREHNFSRYEDKQDNTRLDHTVDKSWKQLRLVT